MKTISAEAAFKLWTTYGFPIELTTELAKKDGFTVDVLGFKQLMEEHRQVSRRSATKKFKRTYG